MTLASFDIFDTTLIRRCGRAENIFYLLANRLYPDNSCKAEDFFLWRCKAEQQAVAREKHANVTIAEIYSGVELRSFSEYTAQDLIRQEKEMERENLMPNPQVTRLINECRQKGYTICFISDMYLDSVFLTHKLQEAGCLQGTEQVIVSCEHQARKSDGKLFQIVRNLLHPTEWKHYGDNLHSDVKMPRKLGIRSMAVCTDFTAVEQNMQLQPSHLRNERMLSVLAGFSRAARLKVSNDSFATIAADYIAPAYIPYVCFILKEAVRKGIKRLYFLSRDSYILYRAAQQATAWGSGLELSYLFLSRKSLMLPYLAGKNGVQMQCAFLEALDRKTVMRKQVASLLALLGVQIEELVENHGITFSYKQIVNRQQEEDFLNKLFHSSYTTVLQQQATARHSLLLEYLKQERVTEVGASAMIDVGWLGTSRLMLNSILKEAGYPSTLFFYCGVRRDVMHARYGEYLSYFSPSQLSTEGTALIENYFSASPWPTTVGYVRNAQGKIGPVFPAGKSYRETSIIRANVEALEQMIAAIAHYHLDDGAVLFSWAKRSLDSIISLKDTVDLTPFTQSDDFDASSFVRKLTPKELLLLVGTGKTITAFDRASLQWTCGRTLMPCLWKIRTWTGKIRRVLFLRLKR